VSPSRTKIKEAFENNKVMTGLNKLMGCVKLILCKDNIIFEQMQVVDEIAITKEDKNHSVLIEAGEVASSGYPHWGKTYYDKVDMQKLMKDLVEENDDLKRRMVVVENEVVRMKRLLKKLRKKKETW